MSGRMLQLAAPGEARPRGCFADRHNLKVVPTGAM
jgi:hypothetical protein